MSKSLRWLLIIPAAASAYAYVRLIAYLTGFLCGDQTWCPLLGDAIAPFVMVLAGAQMAPSRRFLAGAALIVINWLLLNALKPELGLQQSDWLNNVSRLLSITGTLLAAYCLFFGRQADAAPKSQPAPIPEPELEAPLKPTRRLAPMIVKQAPAIPDDRYSHATNRYF